ncbi:MAG TPA: Ran-binding zinc finger domain-containing protein [Longimicrobium sp.]|nr:Ran-binding zinc finger domain-containing protein [Longimicrobium sp.]
MAVREGRWDCPSCGTRGQLGRNLECGSCGAPRPQGIRFYLPGSEPEVTDAARLAEARAGADWVCEHCGSSTRATASVCSNCDAPRGSSPTQPVRDLPAAQVPHTSADAERAQAADCDARRARWSQAVAASRQSAAPGGGVAHGPPPPPPATRGKLLAGCGGLGALGVILVMLVTTCQARNRDSYGGPQAFASPESDTVTFVVTPAVVTDKEWRRTVVVEELRLVEESGQQVPGGARLLDSHQEVVGHQRVFDHNETTTRTVSEEVQTGTETYTCGQRDLGNGYFEDRTCTRPVYGTRTHTETETEPVYRDEPVYATVYRYQVPRWQLDTTLTATSRDSVPPPWPPVSENPTRRMGERQESRNVRMIPVTGERRPLTHSVDSTLYRRLLVGDTVRVTVANSVVRTLVPPERNPTVAQRPDSAAADTTLRDTVQESRVSSDSMGRATKPAGRTASRP